MDAGLACPDWPLCHGSLVPNLADPILAVEYAHRLAAALTTLFLFLTLVACILWFRSERSLVTLSFSALAILVAQVGFGALTITSRLDWVIVTIHLALGTATFATSLCVALLSLVRLPSSVPERAAPD
jgi:cytochrome c oxidase assembly protein subunit 15